MKARAKYALYWLGAALLLAGAGQAAQNGRAPAPKKAAPAAMSVPFAAGERLSYRVMWGPADAATAHLEVVRQHSLHGKRAWHFQAKASTIKAARFLYALDDQFDSYSDVQAIASVQYEMYIREKSKNQDRVIRMNRIGEPPPEGGPSVRVPAGTRDPLGLLYSLRAADWSLKKELVLPLYDGSKLYEIRAKEVAAGTATVPAGTFRASRVELRTFERGKEMTTAKFWIWLASDAQRTPVLIEAEMPFGKLRVELVSTRAE